MAVLLVLVLPEEVVVLLPVPEVVMLFLDAAGVAVGGEARDRLKEGVEKIRHMAAQHERQSAEKRHQYP